jgi:hypothetical protein
MARWPRYRFRTWAREHAPEPLSRLFPPGPKDCGQHEWFREEDGDYCWHCTVGKREHVPKEIEPANELWQWLSLSADAGNPVSRRIVKRMLAEHEAAQRAA